MLVVRPRPENPITTRADLELVVTLRRSWGQPISDRLLGYGLQQRIAAQTSPKWGGSTEQIESPKDLKQLLPRLG